MNLYILQQYQFIQKLYDEESFLDVMMNVDDFFDILNLYAFPNWYECEIVGMKCLRHFTNIVLKSPRSKLPHPKGGMLLTKYDCIVKYKQSTECLPKNYEDEEDMEIDPKTGKRYSKLEKHKVWLVDILIPNKHLINDKVYDLEAIQSKIENSDDTTDLSKQSVLDDTETLEMPSTPQSQNNQQGQM